MEAQTHETKEKNFFMIIRRNVFLIPLVNDKYHKLIY